VFVVKSNLGKNTEELVSQACEVYTVNKTANIQKIPTPFKIIKTQGKFLIAVPEQKSTVDYLGEYEGIPFAMEVKETCGVFFFIASLTDFDSPVITS
jgi:recombination protein U